MKATDTFKALEPHDDKLSGSLHNIMEAYEAIWVPNVHIIKGYTDHGKDHSDRVLDHAVNLLKILKCNNGKDLSEVERYLLLACVYLHDIGMQCDVINFPHMQTVAESLGAKFGGIDFNAKFSNEYSTDEQMEIRNNHQYLTAAWIDCAFRNKGQYPESGFDYLAKSIPGSLVRNLIDICMYHSGSTADIKFDLCDYDKNARIPLIAALLRFADELDADLNRVPQPEKVQKNFRLPLNNIAHWWLNGRTRIYLDYITNKGGKTKGVITFEIKLHPGDSKSYQDLLQKMVIENFKIKNEAPLKILASYDIPITISDDSSIVENSYLEQIPEKILQELTKTK